MQTSAISVLTLTPYSVQTSVLYVLQVLLPPLKKGSKNQRTVELDYL